MTQKLDDTPLTYRRAGVDIAAADALVQRFRALAAATHGAAVRPSGDAYAGLYELPGSDGTLLAATCDGVGTKLLLAQKLRSYRGLGQDLVAMNVNDLLPCGARPLFFLDYIAAGRLVPAVLSEIVAGMADACRQVGCALLGGETAEMPGVYDPEEFDLAGFAVGMVEARRLPRKQDMRAGDRILALPSTGVHSNGLSLARKAIERASLSLSDAHTGLSTTIGEALLAPTALYVEPVLAAFARLSPSDIRGGAHITGGGLLGRARALAQPGLRLIIDPAAYARPPIFALIAESGGVEPAEMAGTFNLGLGFLLVVSQPAAAHLLALPDSPWLDVGHVTSGATGVDLGYANSDAPSR